MFTAGEEGADPPNMGFLFSLADFGVGALPVDKIGHQDSQK